MKNKNKIYFAIFIAFIMITSILGFFYGGSEERFTYKGFSFNHVGEKWITHINGKSVDFDYFPGDVDYINLSDVIISKIKNSKMIYVTYSQNQSNLDEIAIAQFSLSQKLSDFNIYVASAIAEKNDFGLPVINCNNATEFVPVIELRKGYSDSIILEKDCIILDGNLIKLKDRLMYGLYGIIK